MMKNITAYNEILAEKDTYKTPENISSGNSSLIASIKFYINVIRIVWNGNRQTKTGDYNRYNWADSSLDILHSLERSGVEFEITGMKNITSFEGPAIFIANHMSTLETMVLPGIIQPAKSVVFVTKKELTDYPVFGPVNSARHPIIVGRKNPREDLALVFSEGAERIKAGRSVLIFPQKTRTQNLEISNFNTLGIKLAKKNNVPVVPIAIISDAWGNGKIIKEFGKIDSAKKVRFAFGEPIRVKGTGAEEHQKVIEFIKSKFIEWGRENDVK